jgi:AcrR family transcriptional regulator
MQGVAGAPERAAKIATRERIVDCARRLFLCNGYEATSIRSVAREAGLSDPAVHYHFGSKQELLAAVIESQAALAGDSRVHTGVCETRACLVECLVNYFFTYVRLPDLVRMLLREQIVNEPTSTETASRLAQRFVDFMALSFENVYGGRAPLLLDTVDMLLSGVLWDEILDRPDDFAQATRQPAFRERVRGLVALVLPPVCAPPGSAP